MCRFLLAAAVAAIAFSAATLDAPSIAHAQQQASQQQQHYGPDLAAQHAAMDRLAAMAGDWTGDANVLAPVQRHVFQVEHIERDMDGLLLVIHGNGYADAAHSGAPIFKAFGVISYDDRRGVYEFRVYNDGNAATAEARFLDNGDLQWSMAFGPIRFRYTITFTATHWHELGEMSRDGGQTWTQTVELNLDKAS